MTTSNLLNTSTPNLKSLLGNGRGYQVPPFQRDYSWKEENWEDLWLDVEELSGEGRSNHYMGSIVLYQHGVENFTVIDGQQRLATLSLLILAVIDRIGELADSGSEEHENQQRALLLRNAFIGTKQAGSLVESSKLSLNRNDDDFFQSYLVQLRVPPSPRSLSLSNKRLYQAFTYFKRKISESKADHSGQQLAEWIEGVVTVRLLFIQVTVEDEVGAYTVFETLNARGLNLTSADLIKNYLMSLVASHGEADLNHVLNSWYRITDSVKASKLPEFLRHYLNSHTPFVRQERLFRNVRQNVTSADEVLSLVGHLESAAACYAALASSEDDFWRDYSDASRHVQALNLFGVGQYKPLALAAQREFSAQEFTSVLRDCVVLSFRFNVVGQKGTHDLEKQFNLAAIEISNGTVTRASQVRRRLAAVYVDDEEFRSDFATYRLNTSGKAKRLVRYILCELERQEQGADLSWEASRATIEHVLPTQPGECWNASFTHEEHQRSVQRLGNLALLEHDKNRDIGSARFESKAPVLRTSQYALTRDIGECEEWNSENVAARQSRLASIAVARWSFPAD